MNAAEIYQLIKQSQLTLIDIRDASEQIHGVAQGAICLSVNSLYAKVAELSSQSQPVVLMCSQGVRSKKWCKNIGLGVLSAEGGFSAWLEAGLPVSIPNINQSLTRYQQQIKLKGFGTKAQDKLSNTHVLVVGAGGLGSPALMYLAASGVGEISLVDDDEVALSNLQRQIIFQEQDVGLKKVNLAATRLKKLNSTIKINPICARLNQSNVSEIFNQVDVIVDGSDNIETRYLINEYAIKYKVPWVYAAVSAFDIQLAVFGHDNKELCYQCIFPAINPEAIGNCQDEGVLGSVPGIASMLQVTEVIKLITGLGESLRHQMLTYNLLDHQFKVLKYPLNKQCPHR
jgi:molybdopterin/thiamine biosynthesis adenylyltransferase/rhodanese-related sulfurtransferase